MSRGYSPAIDWAAIKTEYISSNLSQLQIAEKYGISNVSVSRHAKKEGWQKLREEYMMNRKAEYDKQKLKPKDINALAPRETKDDEEVKPGSREAFQRYALATLELQPIDREDPIQVEQRINDYFRCCYQNSIKPQKPGIAKWLGISRRTLDRWAAGEFRKLTHQSLIEDAFTKLEEDLYDQVQSGHVNPGSGIFLLKNMFGYRDVQDIVVEPKNVLGDLQDPDELKKRIDGCVVVDLDDDELTDQKGTDSEDA